MSQYRPIVLVCGGRDMSNVDLLFETLNALTPRPGVIVHGGHKGADMLAGHWARSQGVTEVVFPANWDTHGRAAGPIRNTAMIEVMKPDLVVAFPGGTGTADTVRKARSNNLCVLEVPPS